jgi:hypothetical protein
MRRVLMIALVLSLGYAPEAFAAAGKGAFELGIDVLDVFYSSLDDKSCTSYDWQYGVCWEGFDSYWLVRVPASAFRVGYFVTDRVSLETAVQLEYNSAIRDEPNTSGGVALGGQYHFPVGASRQTLLYLGVNGSWSQAMDMPQFSVAGEVGSKVPVAGRLALRVAAGVERAFETGKLTGQTAFGLTVGFSFFAGGPAG